MKGSGFVIEGFHGLPLVASIQSRKGFTVRIAEHGLAPAAGVG